VGNDEKQAYGRLYRSGQVKAVEVVVMNAVDSAIDAVITTTRDSKTEFNELIMSFLRREDHEPPKIPKIYKQF